jgi:hypothetical protein
VNGNVLTLTVKHKSGGNTYVYPVTAGAGWEGGFVTYEVKMPPPEAPIEPELEWKEWGYVSPPEAPDPQVEPEAAASGVGAAKKRFLKVRCSHTTIAPSDYVERIDAYEFMCGNPFRGDPGKNIAYRYAYQGRYWLKKTEKAWHEGKEPTDDVWCFAEGRGAPADPHEVEENTAWVDRRMAVKRCEWLGLSEGGNGGRVATGGHYIAPFGRFVGESRGGCRDQCGGTPNPWTDKFAQETRYRFWSSGKVEFQVDDDY